ncbi:DUF2339 domain-containing protein [uncultured Sulfitobacter sp.]|uniref:DUF2339 domain-containing protein n=1 Tax=uncultured Sulfitobacter sp. TaxID=191468 RepID=UPI00260AED88|nr:DUF2339 domain-containing protein [uncultured Sulfitobacter sp.]
MESLLVLFGAIVLGVPLSIVVLFLRQSGLRRQVACAQEEIAELRRDLNGLRANSAIVPTQSEPSATTPVVAQDASDSADIVGPSRKEIVAPPPVPQQAEIAPLRTSDAVSAVGPWLQRNWFYAVSAASLALAGIFLVQYGMENGLLPPGARIAAALAFGAVLIAGGEWIRRRFGDGEETTTAYLPSVFSGAGIVTLFGAVLSARLLYGLIDGGAAMVGMVAVAGVAVVLGWMHGPLLVAVGVIGAYSAPVVLGRSDADASPLYGYFAAIAIMGLGVDTIRRWGWISVLTLVLAYFMGFVLTWDAGRTVAFSAQLYFLALPLLATLIPARGLWPDHAGRPVSAALFRRGAAGKTQLPGFATSLAFGGMLASSVMLLLLWKPGAVEFWLSTGIFSILALIAVIWSVRAPALQDLAAMPAAALLLSVLAQAENNAVTYRMFASTYTGAPEAAFPWTVTFLVGLGIVLSVAAAWRSLRGGRFAILWAAFAALYAPAMAIMLEVTWIPSTVIGTYPWALHAAALAALMVGLAERFARRDGAAQLRVSFAVISALSCLAFGFVIILSDVALTVALAATVVAAAALDRRWDLSPLSYFIAAGVVTLGYRLVVDPGLAFGRSGPLGGTLLSYGGSLAALVAALGLLRARRRPMARIMLESAAWSFGGMTVSLLIFRWIAFRFDASYFDAHWSLGLNAAIWFGLSLAQVQRAGSGGPRLLSGIRWGLAVGFALLGGAAIVVALTEANPLLNSSVRQIVFGPVLFNTLGAAYLLPASVLLAGVWRLRSLDARARRVLCGLGLALAAFWAVTVIRHFWQGGAAMDLTTGIGQPELYTYTVALLLLGAGLFYQALVRGSAGLRRAGLIAIGLAVAKVFFIDISGLGGLTRVFSLLVLGLSLAGLAWLDRWARAKGQVRPPLRPSAD